MASPSRFAAVDALRGLIMMIMAIDHASAFVSRQHGTEFWNGAISIYSSAFPFLTRWITHLCAPGFFFLMGAGIYWFAASRREAGWPEGQISGRTLRRGFAIFLLGQFLENPVIYLQTLMKPAAVQLSHAPMPMPNDGTSVWWGFITLSALGVVMMVCALLLRSGPWLWQATSVACVIATNSLLPGDGKVGPLWSAILLGAGLSQHVVSVYPVIPWLAVATAGMGFGYWWKAHPAAQSRVWVIGVGLLAVGVGLRLAGGWGNLQPARDAGWIEFLNNVKYPPSLVFWTMSVGIDLLLLGFLQRLPARWLTARSPLIVFGQTPLFFYFVHFYLLVAIGLTIFGEAAPLETAYVVWALVLVLLYPVCAWYGRFKASQPVESFWRML